MDVQNNLKHVFWDGNMRNITVLDYLMNDASQYPDKVAVIEGDNTLSYSELCNKSMNIAKAILESCDGDKKLPVVIFIDKGIKALVSMYGALFSGKFYVPMDVKTPSDRFEAILETLGQYIVVTSSEFEKLLLDLGYEGDYIVYDEVINATRSEADDERILNIKKSLIDTDLMYLIFTSGSTGIPKGVAIMHRSLMDYIGAFLDDIGMSEDDICGNQAPFYADMSDRELFMSLAVGATLCIIPQKMFMFPKKLLQYLDDCKVTFCAWVPTAYRIIMQFSGLEKVRPRYLRRLLFSGESMPIPVYKYWKKHYPEVEFIQSYGPTEITGSCTYYNVNKDVEYNDSDVIPIGKPFSNTGIVLIDEMGEIITEPGHNGEICVYGTCLAAGYYKNAEKTEEAFVPLPSQLGYGQRMYKTGDVAKWNEEGDIVFVSRKDYQVKHMGKRIELGEIESAMATVKEIGACCCVQNRDKDILMLYYVGDISDREIIKKAKEKLPPYMIPGKFISVNELPQLPNGKMDRKLLDQLANQEE